jgi:hypothetical protein
VLNIAFPPSYELAEGAPLEYEIDGCDFQIAESERKKTTNEPELPLKIPFRARDEPEICQVKVNLSFSYCQKETGLCIIKFLKLQIPVQVAKDERNQRIFVEYKVSP